MKKTLYITAILLVLTVTNIFSQQYENQADSLNYTEQEGYLDLTESAIRIEKKIQMPRVSIFDKRIKPNFDHIALNKSFTKEIAGKNEEMKFEVKENLVVLPIKNLQALINKKR